MSLEREERHLPRLIAACYVANFLLGAIGLLYPANSFGQLFSWQWGSLLFMAGSSLFAAKLATDRWHISSAGFILLTIGEGIFYTLQHSPLGRDAQAEYASGILVFVPAMAFLCYYSIFPAWVRVYSLVATQPFLIVMVKIDLKVFDVQRDFPFNSLGFAMVQVASLLWSYCLVRFGAAAKRSTIPEI